MDHRVSGLILAGGQGQRLGGQDKGLVSLNGRPMIAHVIERFAPQVRNSLAISANRNLAAYRKFDFPVLVDASNKFDGPLAGIQAGLKWCTTDYLAVVACDTPLLPLDLVANLLTANEANHTDIAMATADGKRQPVFALLKSSLAKSLDEFLASGNRKIGMWYDAERLSCVEFTQTNAFSNVNTAEDLADVEPLLS